MILAVRKTDKAVFENFACDGLAPIIYLKDLSGKEFKAFEGDYYIVTESNPKFEEYKKARV